VASAEQFWQELRPRQPYAPLTLTPGSGHTMVTWRAQVPSMLSWMTPRLAQAARADGVRPGRTAIVADRRPAVG
jgi:hypothetical protein